MKICYVGMTHLGINSAIAAAEKGFSVICFDPNKELIGMLNKSELPFMEPDALDLLKKNKERLTFTADVTKLKEAGLVYVAPDVPTNDQGESDLRVVNGLLDLVIPNLDREAELVILSQVPPGFTRMVKWDKERLFYQVETLIFGRAIERALYPERFIVGHGQGHGRGHGIFLEAFGCPVIKMGYEAAELCKIAINMFLVSSVTTANTIAFLCEKLGADFTEMIPALRLDKRIGKDAYLNPGLGLSGGNLERDLTTFTKLADQLGCECDTVRAWQKNSGVRREWVLKKIHEEVLPQMPHPKFGILGLSYKKDTSSLKNSPSLALISSLSHFSIRAFDPVVKELPDLYHDVETLPSAEEVIKECDVLIVMTPWDSFSALSLDHFKGKIVIDPFGILAKQGRFKYFQLGKPC